MHGSPGCKLTSRQPLVTGTSVLGIKYKDGVMLAADNLGKLSLGVTYDELTFQPRMDRSHDSRTFRDCIP
jgi:hypothetical protein